MTNSVIQEINKKTSGVIKNNPYEAIWKLIWDGDSRTDEIKVAIENFQKLGEFGIHEASDMIYEIERNKEQ